MNPLTNHRPLTDEQPLSRNNRAAEVLRSIFTPIASELAEVEQIFRQQLRSDDPYVDELARYGCLLGGKRLRPALLLLAGKATGVLQQEHLLLAAVVEMIHTATLVHDDILDDAQMRRHIVTVHSRWDHKSSVLLGDYLFTHAFYLASTTGDTFACRTIGKATNIVCEGEMRQIGARANYSLSEGEYIKILEAKTAELCACCCLLGAHFAGAASGVAKRLEVYGRSLGIAFQIADDVLDLMGDEQTVGKSLGTDLLQQKPTLPFIRVWQCSSQRERTRLRECLEENAPGVREYLFEQFDRFEAISYARTRAKEYAELAQERLTALSPSDCRDILAALTEFVVSRSQ